MLTNCVNCGAPLPGSKCEYCGTKYNNGGVFADFGRGDMTGRLHRVNPVMKHTFTLIEI